MKAEVDKLDINKLVNVPSGLNNLKTKVIGLDGDQLKAVPVDLKKLVMYLVKQLLKNGV